MRHILLLVLALCSISSVAMAAVVETGQCGRHATWTFTDDGTLRITGTKRLYQYAALWRGRAPWTCYCDDVKTLIVSEGVEYFNPYCFDELFNVETIYLPSTIKHISGLNLRTRSGFLMDIHVHEDNPHYCSVDGILYNKDMSTLVKYPSGREGEFYVPACVKKIGENAFEKSRLSSVVLPQNLKKIERAAFRSSNIERLNLPSGLTSIGDYAFKYTKLETVYIPESVKKIGRYAFERTPLNEIVIDAKVKDIKEGTFEGCSDLYYVKIAGNTRSIHKLAFKGCWSLRSIYIMTTKPSKSLLNNSPKKIIVIDGAKENSQPDSYPFQKEIYPPKERCLPHKD